MNNPANISGLANLLSAANSDITKLEQEIINGTETENTNDVDLVSDFKSEIDRLTSEMGLDQPQQPPPQSVYIDINDDGQQKNQPPKWNSVLYREEGADLKNMTIEAQKQNHVDSVFKNITINRDIDIDMNKERDDDEKASILERIDMLRMTLIDDSVDISSVPNVTTQNSLREIKDVYKILQLKNDRNRYSSLADEVILSLAGGLEFLFDGKKEYFGRRPDLTDWSSSLKIKLRRAKFETSSFVQDIMTEYNCNSWVRLAIEIIPSMLLYSRNRRSPNNTSLLSDERYKTEQAANSAISALNNL